MSGGLEGQVEPFSLEYYLAQSGAPHIRIIKSDRAPPVRLHNNLFVAISNARTEPLTNRIVEVLDGDHEQFGQTRWGEAAIEPWFETPSRSRLARLHRSW